MDMFTLLGFFYNVVISALNDFCFNLKCKGWVVYVNDFLERFCFRYTIFTNIKLNLIIYEILDEIQGYVDSDFPYKLKSKFYLCVLS